MNGTKDKANSKQERQKSRNLTDNTSESDMRRTPRRLQRIKDKCEFLYGTPIESHSSKSGGNEIQSQSMMKSHTKSKIPALRKKAYACNYESADDEWLSPNKCSKKTRKLSIRNGVDSRNKQSQPPTSAWELTSSSSPSLGVFDLQSERITSTEKNAAFTKATARDKLKQINHQITARIVAVTHDKCSQKYDSKATTGNTKCRRKSSKAERRMSLVSIPTDIVLPPYNQLSFHNQKSSTNVLQDELKPRRSRTSDLERENRYHKHKS